MSREGMRVTHVTGGRLGEYPACRVTVPSNQGSEKTSKMDQQPVKVRFLETLSSLELSPCLESPAPSCPLPG